MSDFDSVYCSILSYLVCTFWMTFCKNSIRISRQINFCKQTLATIANKSISHHSRQYFNVICDDDAHINIDVQLFF